MHCKRTACFLLILALSVSSALPCIALIPYEETSLPGVDDIISTVYMVDRVTVTTSEVHGDTDRDSYLSPNTTEYAKHTEICATEISDTQTHSHDPSGSIGNLTANTDMITPFAECTHLIRMHTEISTHEAVSIGYHRRVTYIIETCKIMDCTYLKELPTVYGPNEAHTKSLVDCGHTNSTTHKYDEVCRTCAFIINTYTIPCNGKPHIAPYSIPIDLISE